MPVVAMPDTSHVEFRGVEKRYDGDRPAVADLNLSVRQGEFMTLLGPSGSGKTTTLMMLAGFEAPTRGEISVAGRSLAGLPPHRRNMGVVFQSYALFPHMTVARNVRFPLDVRGINGAEAEARIAEVLALVNLEGFAHRRPDQLSGGQRQRVALARALVFRPDIVLMDEPLGALDRQLRERLQLEIKRIQSQLGITVLYVTHDQGEALTMSDRIAVFSEGLVQQVDTPQNIYDRPANAFVAGFIGENNGIPGVVTARDGEACEVRIAGDLILRATPVGAVAPGDPVLATVRPEHVVREAGASAACNSFPASIDTLVYHGDHSRLRAVLPGGATVMMRASGNPAEAPDGTMTVGWCRDRCLAFPASAAGGAG